MKIIIVNGKGGCGKTTFEQLATEKSSYKIGIVSTIDYVKNVATAIGWNGIKDDKSRKLLSDLKRDLTEWNDLPFKKVAERLYEYKGMCYDFVFIDCREPDEIDRYVKEYNAITLLINRDEVNRKYGNISDDNVDNYLYDFVVDNNGTLQDLEDSMHTFFSALHKIKFEKNL